MLNQVIQCFETCNTEFDEIIITFTNQNTRPLETEDQVNLALLINKQKRYARWAQQCDNIIQNQEKEDMLKDMGFYHLQKNIKNNYFVLML